jgi:hypothetical protein
LHISAAICRAHRHSLDEWWSLWECSASAPSGPFAPLNSTIRDYDLSTGENGFSSSTRVNLNFEDSFSSTGFLILIDANGPDNFSVQLTDSQGVLRGTRINVTTAQYGIRPVTLWLPCATCKAMARFRWIRFVASPC